jgi:hypothetical protein
MFLIDTDVLSERRKGAKADRGVVEFLDRPEHELFLPVQVVGELRSGIEGLKLRGDLTQAQQLEAWFQVVLEEYSTRILPFNLQCAQIWGVLMGANDQHIVDRQIASIALTYDLTVVTRNTGHFSGMGVKLLNPFHSDAPSGGPAN